MFGGQHKGEGWRRLIGGASAVAALVLLGAASYGDSASAAGPPSKIRVESAHRIHLHVNRRFVTLVNRTFRASSWLAEANGKPPPPSPPSNSREPIGVQFHCNWSFYDDVDRVRALDKMQAAGVTWVRIDTAWAGIEDSAKGARNSWWVRKADFCVNQARAHGMHVLMTMWLTPGWANGNAGERVPPANPQDYADFMRWAAGYFRGRVDAWEIWNEPDPRQTFWRGSTSQYVSLLRAAYPAIKAGDPNSLVVLGGPSCNDSTWIRDIYSLGAKPYFDVMATHPYQGMADAPPETPDDGNPWWFTHTPSVRAVMRQYGDGAKPFWFTEMGWSEHSDWPGIANWQRGVTPEQQADYFIRAINYTVRNYPYVKVMFWYKERAEPGDTDVHEQGYALLNSDLSPRPVYTRLKQYLTGR